MPKKPLTERAFIKYAGFIGTGFSIIFAFVLAKIWRLDPVETIVPAIGSQVLGLVTQNFASNLDRKDDVKFIREKIEELTTRVDLKIVGASGVAELKNIDKVRSARNVRNTFVSLSQNRSKGELSARVRAFYTAWYENGLEGTWEDIAGVEEKGDDRFTNWTFPTPRSTKAHIAYFIPKGVLFINFSIFEYADGTRELMFGWLPDMRKFEFYESNIFSSSNEQIINTFEAFFERLKSISETKADGTLGLSIEH